MSEQCRLWHRSARHMPVAWSLLSTEAQMVSLMLPKVLDENDRLPLKGLTPQQAFTRAAGIATNCRRMVNAGLEALLADGCIRVTEDGHLDCSDLHELQMHRAFERAHKPSTRSRLSTDSVPTPSALPPDSLPTPSRLSQYSLEPNPMKSLWAVTREEKNREEKNREETEHTHTDAHARVSVLSSLSSGLSSNLESVVRELTRGYQARYEKHANDAWMAAAQNRREIQSVAAYVAAVPGETSEVVADVLDGFFANEWATKERWPWRALARNPGSYRPDRTAEREAAARRKRWDEHAAREAARQVELAKQPQEPSKVMSQAEIEKMASDLMARLSTSMAMPTNPTAKRKTQEAAE